MNILITGGAGFIGTHLTKALRAVGFDVVIFDSLDPQVHKKSRKDPQLIRADIRDRDALTRQIKRCDIVVHLAAAVGVGQSQYQIDHYIDVNVRGTALLLDILANESHQIKKLIVASSMSCYGEGAYNCDICGRVRPSIRLHGNSSWEPQCPICSSELSRIPTKETDRLISNSVYAISKMCQEELVLAFGSAYDIPSTALRFFNVYGPGQSLSNPYTGVAAIFLSRLKNGSSPLIYEDGLQSRDFISVHDIIQACLLVITTDLKGTHIYNVGTGEPTTILQLTNKIIKKLAVPISPIISKTFRSGDIRHCYADISKISKDLGFTPKVTLENGLDELLDWASHQDAQDHFDEAQKHLRSRNLA